MERIGEDQAHLAVALEVGFIFVHQLFDRGPQMREYRKSAVSCCRGKGSQLKLP